MIRVMTCVMKYRFLLKNTCTVCSCGSRTVINKTMFSVKFELYVQSDHVTIKIKG